MGKDINYDKIPDVPLRYEIHDSNMVVEFPLGFCPNAIGAKDYDCQGNFGIVIKEWETITRVSTKNIQ